MATALALGSLLAGGDWLGRGALTSGNAAGTYEQVNTAFTGNVAPFTATDSIGGVTISISSGFKNTYGTGGSNPGSFYSFYSTQGQNNSYPTPTSVTWTFSTAIRQVKLSYGYVGPTSVDPQYFSYSTDGTTFLPIDLTSSVVTAHVGNVEGQSQNAGTLTSGGSEVPKV